MTLISQKLQKLASAVYLVSSFFDDKEPLKWRLRTLSTDVISEVKDKYNICKEISLLFSIAKNAGLVSEINYNILINELSKIEQETEKPLDLAFLREPIADERTLLQPQKREYIKDNITEKPALKEFGAVSVKKNSRQSVIINILKRKKEIMIKDVSPLIDGCSEKTIQRELSAMVRSGILKKVGEKRWSRYTLA